MLGSSLHYAAPSVFLRGASRLSNLPPQPHHKDILKRSPVLWIFIYSVIFNILLSLQLHIKSILPVCLASVLATWFFPRFSICKHTPHTSPALVLLHMFSLAYRVIAKFLEWISSNFVSQLLYYLRCELCNFLLRGDRKSRKNRHSYNRS